MRLLLAAIGLTIVTGSAAQAALPPQYQRQAELLAILQSDAVIDAFGISLPIEGIRLVETDLYEVTSGACTLPVRIVDVARPDAEAGFVGPRNFAVEAGQISCTEASKP